LEGNNWHDNTWGNCLCDKCKGIEGKNLLGNILMQVREELCSEADRLRLFVPSPSSRFFPQVSQFLKLKGIPLDNKGKELFSKTGNLDILLARGFDIPKAVAMGWGDIGITGLDTLHETQTGVIVLCNLGIRFSEVIIARPYPKRSKKSRSMENENFKTMIYRGFLNFLFLKYAIWGPFSDRV
jgi:hypothetical protein